MVYNMVSVFNVIEKIYRDYDSQEELDIYDCIEWAAEALEFIGAGQQYEKGLAHLKIKNNTACLPCDFHSQPIPSHNGIPMTLATGGFAPIDVQSTSANNNSVNGNEANQESFPRLGGTSSTGSTYYIRDGVFITSISEGDVLLDYRAIAVDEEGFPKIPDLVSYRTAVAKYVQKMLDHRDLRKGRIQKYIADQTEADWNWYCKQARGAANMPNLSYAESIKNQWVKLKPNQNSASSFYNNGSVREMRKLK